MEINSFQKRIKTVRTSTIPKPVEVVEEVFFTSEFSRWNTDEVILNASDFVLGLRALSWAKYLSYEQEFNVAIAEILAPDMGEAVEEFSSTQVISKFLVEYSEHLFELAKSTTNSRRSRAGKEFEKIVELLLDCASIPFDSQGKIGKQSFEAASLGKIVDCVIPSVNQYRIQKRDCILVSMKTTLRERWAEVVEEMNRTGASEMMLVSLDDSVSGDTLEKLALHNITLVVPRATKLSAYSSNQRVYDFEWLLAEMNNIRVM